MQCSTYRVCVYVLTIHVYAIRVLYYFIRVHVNIALELAALAGAARPAGWIDWTDRVRDVRSCGYRNSLCEMLPEYVNAVSPSEKVTKFNDSAINLFISHL